MKKLTIPVVLIATLLYGSPHAASGQQKNNQQAARPNIVIIMADDLDSRQLSCYGGQNLQTTHIDALAAEGMKFNQMIASEAMCIPTRASLFTGLYPARHGAYQNHKSVRPGLKSVAHYLNDLGYGVALTGKNHVTKPKAVFPFEIIEGFEPICVAKTDDYTLDSIRRYITRREKPFCLFVMSINPHGPWTVGDPSEFDADRLQLPAHWVDTELIREQFTRYLAEVRRLDDQVGDVMQLLKETGQDKNTIVIFLGEQGAQFPGAKWTLWDSGQKSSMIVRWPGRVPQGSESDAIIQYEDVTPTLIDIAGGKPINGLDGRSFLAVLDGRRTDHRDYAFGIHNNIPEGPPYPIRSIRSHRYKLILNLTPDSTYYIKYMMNPAKPNHAYATWLHRAETDEHAAFLAERIANRPAVEFYDLHADPYEIDNLANEAAHRNTIATMRTELEAWMQRQGDRGAAMDKPFKRK
ncbi:sulfatase family protein [Parapedobacter sp. 10938]|uniref:sulfatase family protein n=1 Tax=Parapedobacter flavus TaxID=3110225 RepID=UPI002DB62DF8|nr:sulfatase [Parapedobacter sp. 10938]MEC3880122.1 sulfatase [Parapedobacter sp. 10938]